MFGHSAGRGGASGDRAVGLHRGADENSSESERYEDSIAGPGASPGPFEGIGSVSAIHNGSDSSPHLRVLAQIHAEGLSKILSAVSPSPSGS